MRAYDCIMIFKPNLGDEATKKLIESIHTWITSKNGRVIYDRAVGNKELAYAINKSSHGYYYHVQFLATPAVLEELRSRIMVTEDIVRDLIVRMDSLMTKAEVEARVEGRELVKEVAEAPADATA